MPATMDELKRGTTYTGKGVYRTDRTLSFTLDSVLVHQHKESARIASDHLAGSVGVEEWLSSPGWEKAAKSEEAVGALRKWVLQDITTSTATLRNPTATLRNPTATLPRPYRNPTATLN